MLPKIIVESEWNITVKPNNKNIAYICVSHPRCASSICIPLYFIHGLRELFAVLYRMIADLSKSCYMQIYANIHSITIPTLHIVYFSCGLIITAAKVALSPARPPMHELGTHLSSVRVLLASASQALIDLALLAAIYCEYRSMASCLTLLGVPLTRLVQDGTSASVFQSCSAAAYLLGLGLIYGVYTLGLVAGVCVVIVSALVYISIPNPEDLPKVSTLFLLHILSHNWPDPTKRTNTLRGAFRSLRDRCVVERCNTHLRAS